MKQHAKNAPEVLDLIIKMQDQLNALDKKIDALMMRALVGKTSTPTPPQNDHNQKGKMMYQIICADCKKESSIPFKPSGDRPVYCKECFSKRRSGGGNPVQINVDQKPREVLPVQEVKEVSSTVKEKKKPAAAKKAVVKKKASSKKTIKKK